jgi:putative phage-type endonuclease
MSEIIPYTDEKAWLEMRTKVLTSTDIGALFGISPYCTLYELWHRKHDGYQVAFEPNQRMKLGTALQDAIAHYAAAENKWNIRRMDEFIQNVDLRLGSSFDYSIENENMHMGFEADPSVALLKPIGLLEVKNVDYMIFKKDWIEKEDGSIEAPLHIEIQCQHELLVSGLDVLWLAVLVGGNDLKLIKRTPDQRIFDAIKQKSAEFWQSIDSNTPPSPNLDTDADFIKTMFQLAEPGKVISVKGNEHINELVARYTALKEFNKANELKTESIKAEIITLIGDAEKILGDNYSIDAGITGSSPRNFIMPAFRRFRVFKKGAK